jgi:mono/diheme cytochrome c family protein
MRAMKTALKVLGGIVGALVLVVGGLVSFVAIAGIPKYPAPPPLDVKIEVTPERVKNGKRIVSMVCAECHYDQKTGRLSGQTVAGAPPMLGAMRSRNITKDPDKGIGKWTDGQLVTMLRTILKPDGTPNAMMPPVGFHLADEDLVSVIAFLRSDDPWVQATPADDPDSEPSLLWKALWRFRVGSFKPISMPTAPIVIPDKSDKVAFGRYLVLGRAECYGCHSPDITKVNFADPEKTDGHLGGGWEMADATGAKIVTANITFDETGLAGWSEADFATALRSGFRKDHSLLRYPMPRYFEFTDDEVSAIYAYLQQVPKVHRERAPRVAAPIPVASPEHPGKQLYYKYQCQSCHGELGTGVCDLRGAHKKYPTDDALIAWIRDPSKLLPDTKMPTWNGVIAEADYQPLCDWVRKLGN